MGSTRHRGRGRTGGVRSGTRRMTGAAAAAAAGALLLVPAIGIGTEPAVAGAAGASPLPTLPQLNQLPLLSSIPDLGALPEIPGITVGPQATVTDPAVGGSFGSPFAEPGVSCPGETEGASATDPYNANAERPHRGSRDQPHGGGHRMQAGGRERRRPAHPQR